MQNDVLYNRIMKKIDELEPGGGGGSVPIYSIVVEGSDLSNAVMEGNYSEALNRLENGLPIFILITHYMPESVAFYTYFASTYEVDISEKIVIYESSGRGWMWDSDGSLEYFD